MTPDSPGRRLRRVFWLALPLLACASCARQEPPAIVEGTLRRNGLPLEDCLVTFFAESGTDPAWSQATGLTDPQGHFQLRNSRQQVGNAVGWHRVTIQDLAVARGRPRRDHGTVDQDQAEERPAASVRRSRVPEAYQSLERTPLSREIQPGRQVIDLDLP